MWPVRWISSSWTTAGLTDSPERFATCTNRAAQAFCLGCFFCQTPEVKCESFRPPYWRYLAVRCPVWVSQAVASPRHVPVAPDCGIERPFRLGTTGRQHAAIKVLVTTLVSFTNVWVRGIVPGRHPPKSCRPICQNSPSFSRYVRYDPERRKIAQGLPVLLN
jgi:hypothetical protein